MFQLMLNVLVKFLGMEPGLADTGVNFTLTGGGNFRVLVNKKQGGMWVNHYALRGQSGPFHSEKRWALFPLDEGEATELSTVKKPGHDPGQIYRLTEWVGGFFTFGFLNEDAKTRPGGGGEWSGSSMDVYWLDKVNLQNVPIYAKDGRGGFYLSSVHIPQKDFVRLAILMKWQIGGSCISEDGIHQYLYMVED